MANVAECNSNVVQMCSFFQLIAVGKLANVVQMSSLLINSSRENG